MNTHPSWIAALPTLALLALSGACVTVQPNVEPLVLPGPDEPSAPKLQLRAEPDTSFGRCSPYYDLDMLDPLGVGDEGLRATIQDSRELAMKDDRRKAWETVEGSVNDAWSDVNALFSIMVILGAYLDGSGWMAQVRYGPSYQRLNARVYELAPGSLLVQLSRAALLLRSPVAMGGDPEEARRILAAIPPDVLPEYPLYYYAHWYDAMSREDTPAGLVWATKYLDLCPDRPDVRWWFDKHKADHAPQASVP